jgi:hypothetical protein
MPPLTPVESTSDPVNYFEATVSMAVTIQIRTYDTGCVIVPYDDFIIQRLPKACKMYVITAQPYTCL